MGTSVNEPPDRACQSKTRDSNKTKSARLIVLLGLNRFSDVPLIMPLDAKTSIAFFADPDELISSNVLWRKAAKIRAEMSYLKDD